MKRKKATKFIAYSLFALIILPVTITVYMGDKVPAPDAGETNAVFEPAQNDSPNELPEEKETFETPAEEVSVVVDNINTEQLENYIVCVVAAEMPALFDEEALKAQAVAARTYAVNQMKSNNFSLEEMIAFGGQAYIDNLGMKNKWGTEYEKYYNKIKSAVDATKGEMMIYEGEPILAVFHAISHGQTEDAVNVWKEDIPYLKSVDSADDMNAAEYTYEVSFTTSRLEEILKEKYENFSLEGDIFESMEIRKRSNAGYVSEMKIGNLIFTGRQVREALGLRSAGFTFRKDGNDIIFTTGGYGHGAGMSQYGAHAMALKGKTYKEILSHYYTGISFAKIK
ncbi:MAG: stage II sporulation protein D [Firmicutes bacterium]|nr:stage II sporulation protein D [Bacillota bacterium]